MEERSSDQQQAASAGLEESATTDQASAQADNSHSSHSSNMADENEDEAEELDDEDDGDVEVHLDLGELDITSVDFDFKDMQGE